jgi:hypothetical protein
MASVSPQSTPKSRPTLFTFSIVWSPWGANHLRTSKTFSLRRNIGDISQTYNLGRHGSRWQRMSSFPTFSGWGLRCISDVKASVMFSTSSPLISIPHFFDSHFYWFAARDCRCLKQCGQKVLWGNRRGGPDRSGGHYSDEGCSKGQATILQGPILKVHSSCKSQVWWWVPPRGQWFFSSIYTFSYYIYCGDLIIVFTSFYRSPNIGATMRSLRCHWRGYNWLLQQ